MPMHGWYKRAQEDPFEFGEDEDLDVAADKAATVIEEEFRNATMSNWSPVPRSVMKGVRPDMRNVTVQARVINGRGQFRYVSVNAAHIADWWESETFTNDYEGWKNSLDKFLQIPTGEPFATFYGWLKDRFGVTIPIRDTLT